MEVALVINLAKLEMKKNNMKGFIKWALICNLAFTGLLVLVIFTSQHARQVPFKNFEQVFFFFQNTVQNTFIIFASVLISRFIIDEYKNKTINVLFMYPVSRKKLIITKLTIIMVFTFISIVVSTGLIGAEIWIINNFCTFLLHKPTNDDLIRNFFRLIGNALSTSALSLIPLYFGMRKKTVPATIITAVVIVAIVGSNNGRTSLITYIAVQATLSVIGLAIAFLSFRNIEKTDIDN
jgi:ABC-type transport system involved in multi-copper enzyme maturation permease subunit